jgi:molybdate-binding protein
MPKPTRLIPVLTKSVEKIQRDNMLESIDALRRRIDAGEVSRFGLVECRTNGDYTTEFTSAMHKREDAAMLIDLALRLMGFVSKNKDDEFV